MLSYLTIEYYRHNNMTKANCHYFIFISEIDYYFIFEIEPIPSV
jgi:hypothetical protein